MTAPDPAQCRRTSGAASTTRRCSASFFLLSRVGRDWDEVYSEAVSRLDRPDPIFWMVARAEDAKKPFVLMGESSYCSGLFVDADKRLAIVDPNLRVEHMKPGCACCTHTFNGVAFIQKYDPDDG